MHLCWKTEVGIRIFVLSELFCKFRDFWRVLWFLSQFYKKKTYNSSVRYMEWNEILKSEKKINTIPLKLPNSAEIPGGEEQVMD